MSCHWSKMDDKILRFLKREYIAGFGGRSGVGVDWSLGTLRSNVAAADYQPSFPLHTAAKSQVPRMLILHTKQLKIVHGDLKGQGPLLQSYRLLSNFSTLILITGIESLVGPRLSLNVISKFKLSMRQSKDGARREYIAQRKGATI
jgi:hypothetical protein